MDLPICKCCGQTLPGALDFEGTWFTPMQRRLIERVRVAGQFGVTLKMLVHSAYANDPDGGPLHAERSVHVQLCNANKQLAKIGRRIQANKKGGQGSFYRLVQI